MTALIGKDWRVLPWTNTQAVGIIATLAVSVGRTAREFRREMI